jgi:hypothetical protein
MGIAASRAERPENLRCASLIETVSTAIEVWASRNRDALNAGALEGIENVAENARRASTVSTSEMLVSLSHLLDRVREIRVTV